MPEKNGLENSSAYEGDKALFAEYKATKDKEIRDELVHRYLYIAEIIAKKYANRGIEYDDIYQVASLAVIKAVERYDVDRGYEFSSFATPTVIGEVKRYFRDKGWVIRVPRRIQELNYKINKSKEKLTQKLKRTPKVSDIAEYLGVDEEEILEAMESGQVYAPQSIEATYDNLGDDNDLSLLELIGREEKGLVDIENKYFLDDCLSRLNPLEKKIINARFFEEKTQNKVASELGVSQMYVSRMERRIIKKLQGYYKQVVNS
ncbi:MAG: SigB/SigF/SigG family RNA polymerase sigma factor [Clostridia bacterium]|nr:SigB/SigF/SigG family RNA polymerase sigma factor [Clostridia bacterium]